MATRHFCRYCGTPINHLEDGQLPGKCGICAAPTKYLMAEDEVGPAAREPEAINSMNAVSTMPSSTLADAMMASVGYVMILFGILGLPMLGRMIGAQNSPILTILSAWTFVPDGFLGPLGTIAMTATWIKMVIVSFCMWKIYDHLSLGY